MFGFADIRCDRHQCDKCRPVSYTHLDVYKRQLTESAYTGNPKAIKEMMEQLQKKGFSILMDDFASGYSSLNVLKDIAVDVLKICLLYTSIDGTTGNIYDGAIKTVDATIAGEFGRVMAWADKDVYKRQVQRSQADMTVERCSRHFLGLQKIPIRRKKSIFWLSSVRH